MKIPPSLTPEQIQKFNQEGYLIAPDVFDPEDLEPLRQSLHGAITRKTKELKATGELMMNMRSSGSISDWPPSTEIQKQTGRPSCSIWKDCAGADSILRKCST